MLLHIFCHSTFPCQTKIVLLFFFLQKNSYSHKIICLHNFLFAKTCLWLTKFYIYIFLFCHNPFFIHNLFKLIYVTKLVPSQTYFLSENNRKCVKKKRKKLIYINFCLKFLFTNIFLVFRNLDVKKISLVKTNLAIFFFVTSSLSQNSFGHNLFLFFHCCNTSFVNKIIRTQWLYCHYSHKCHYCHYLHFCHYYFCKVYNFTLVL